MRAVLDTGPLVAWLRQSERAHAAVARILVRSSLDIFIPDPVLVETDYIVRSRGGTAAARALFRDIREGNFRRVPMDDPLFGRALAYDDAFGDLDLGYADASVMAVAERERAQIITFDFTHFRATRPLRGGFWRLLLQESDLPGPA